MSEAHDHQSPVGDTWGQQGQGRLQAFAVVAGILIARYVLSRTFIAIS